MTDLAAIDALIAQGKRGEAFRQLVEAKQEAVGNPAQLRKIANALGAIEEFSAATDMWRDVMRLVPQDISAVFSMLNAWAGQKLGPVQQHELDSQIKLAIARPDFTVKHWYRVCSVYRRMGYFDQALEAAAFDLAGGGDVVRTCKQILQTHKFLRNVPQEIDRRGDRKSILDPKQPRQILLLLLQQPLTDAEAAEFAELAMELGEHEAALDLTRYRLGKDDGLLDAHLVLAEALAATGKSIEASDSLHGWIDALVAGKNETVILRAAKIFGDAENFGDQVALLDKAVTACGQTVQLRQTLVWARSSDALARGKPSRQAAEAERPNLLGRIARMWR